MFLKICKFAGSHLICCKQGNSSKGRVTLFIIIWQFRKLLHTFLCSPDLLELLQMSPALPEPIHFHLSQQPQTFPAN